MVKIGITKRKGDKESKGNGDVLDGIHKDMQIKVLRREIVLELHVDQERSKESQEDTKMSEEVREETEIKKEHYTREAYI